MGAEEFVKCNEDTVAPAAKPSYPKLPTEFPHHHAVAKKTLSRLAHFPLAGETLKLITELLRTTDAGFTKGSELRPAPWTPVSLPSIHCPAR